MTPSNQTSPWLNFEAGAISKDLGDGRVVPYLHALTIPNMISGPLRQFHAKEAERKGTWEMVQAINSRAEVSILPDRLSRTFEVMWPRLESELSNIEVPTNDIEKSVRNSEDKIDEILEILPYRDGDESSLQVLGNQIRGLGVLIAQDKKNSNLTEQQIKIRIFEILSIQMRAFLKPAEMHYIPEKNKILFILIKETCFIINRP